MSQAINVQGLFPNGRVAAVSLTYDDCLSVHLDHAMPDLESRQLRGTFYIPTALAGDCTWTQRRGEWRSAARRGHELGNHTADHPCSASHSWVPKGYTLEDYDLARMEAELRQVSAEITEVAGWESPMSFAYPCGQDWVGPDHVSFRPLVARLFVAGRGGGAEIADPRTCDLTYIPSKVMTIEDTAEQAAAFLDWAVAQGGWAVFMFHGVGGGHTLNVSRQTHQAICQAVAERRQRLWCDTFVNVALHIRKAMGRLHHEDTKDTK